MIKTIILAAGKGERLRPYTETTPKCLVKINDKRLLDYQLDVLKSAQIEPIILVAGYLAEQLQIAGCKTYLNPRYAETNMVWTLFCAEEEMDGDVIISYGDIVYSKEVLNTLIQSSHDITVVIDRGWEDYWKKRSPNPLDDAETLRIDKKGRIVEVGQKPERLDEIEGQYIGLMKFSAKGLSILRKVFTESKSKGNLRGKLPENAYMTDLLQALIDEGHDVWPAFIDGGWVEVDTTDDMDLPITRQRLEAVSNL